MQKNKVITVQNLPITISKEEIDDYICITDIAAAKSDDSRAADVVRNWLRNRRTLEFLSTWEEMYNPNFKVFESEHLKKNVALFGFTAKAWRESNPELAKQSNVRDYATINELTVLSNLETHNAQMIREGKSKEERFQILKEIADYQMQILSVADNIAHIEEKQNV